MKLPTFKSAILGILLLGFPLGAYSQKSDILNNPGYLNLDELIENSDDYITSEIYLQNYILKMIAKVARKSEPDFAKMLSSIHLIRVLEFEFDENENKGSKAIASKLVRKLSSGNWDTLVRTRDENSNVNISIQSDKEDHIYALAIVSWEDESMTIVNVVGDIDLEMLARLGEQFDIDALEDIEDLDIDE